MCSFALDHEVNIDDADVVRSSSTNYISQLRWDKADLKLYRDVTEHYLQPIYSELLELERGCSITANAIDYLYNRIVDILTFSADTAVPKCKKNFFKFCWDSDMDELNIRTRQGNEREYFTNDLHEALLKKTRQCFLEMLEVQVRSQARQN